MKGLSRQRVFEAANQLVTQGLTPTQEKLRTLLGSGSKGTIHKYLKEWKASCFKQIDPTTIDSGKLQALLNEKHHLETIIARQIGQHENLTAPLIEVEYQCAEERKKCQGLELELAALKAEQTKIVLEWQRLQAAYQTFQDERANTIRLILQDKNQAIEALKEELKELNQVTLKEVREVSYRANDILMTEKVKLLALQNKLTEREQVIEQLQQQLTREQVANQLLRKTLEKQRQLITKYVPFEQLQAEESSELC